MELTTMHCKIEGAVAQLTFNRPEVINAMNVPWPQDFLKITEALAREKQVRVLVISGTGRGFSSGIDLKVLSQGGFPLEWFRDVERALRSLELLDKIVISAIHGYCIGGGMQVALASDIRIVTENTKFALTAVKECLVPGMGTYRLARYIGLGRAKRIILSGDFIDAREAHTMGLVDYLVPDADFKRRVEEITEVYLRAASEGQRQSKRLLDLAFKLDWASFLEEYMISQIAAVSSENHKEAMLAQREKREPRY
ncbi:MAG: enoyl-CoA hydratase/isomerase family protein [Acidobacteriia bacterium]|nr:enoyl-CoA hydratase/isomerase family protein [Terriglobia bacterium]